MKNFHQWLENALYHPKRNSKGMDFATDVPGGIAGDAAEEGGHTKSDLSAFFLLKAKQFNQTFQKVKKISEGFRTRFNRTRAQGSDEIQQYNYIENLRTYMESVYRPLNNLTNAAYNTPNVLKVNFQQGWIFLDECGQAVMQINNIWRALNRRKKQSDSELTEIVSECINVLEQIKDDVTHMLKRYSDQAPQPQFRTRKERIWRGEPQGPTGP